ncbi:hypothetical protein [Sphingobium sp. Leaf26]|uniref:hypothetical protein n=1 Tax=Sphingobium sp. Leaf26 TaxID=1735693 RepID=UPI00138F1A9E|nr:hypothetical protein [Sphingobium sp. Leaf26]
MNERLFVAGLLQDFEDAVQQGDRAAASKILKAVGVEWPDEIARQRLEFQEIERPKRLFWLLLLLAGTLVGVWLYHLNNGTVLPCQDGHCPDAGTPEYLAGVKDRNREAPMVGFVAGAAVFVIGAAIRTVMGWIRRRST